MKHSVVCVFIIAGLLFAGQSQASFSQGSDTITNSQIFLSSILPKNPEEERPYDRHDRKDRERPIPKPDKQEDKDRQKPPKPPLEPFDKVNPHLEESED